MKGQLGFNDLGEITLISYLDFCSIDNSRQFRVNWMVSGRSDSGSASGFLFKVVKQPLALALRELQISPKIQLTSVAMPSMPGAQLVHCVRYIPFFFKQLTPERRND